MKNSNLFRSDWKDYFSLSNPLRKGLIVLFSLLMVEVAVLFYLNFVPVKRKSQDVEKFKAEIEKFLASNKQDSLQNSDDSEREETSSGTNDSSAKAKLFQFDPNNLPAADWKQLGFSDKQIRVIKNYEAKGGRFYSNSDVKKIYSISEKEYQRIEPYIEIPTNSKKNSTVNTNAAGLPNQKFTTPSSTSQKKSNTIVDLNTADTTELQKLYGIGPVKARIISNYREKLGGFYSISQLHEVWGISDSLFESLKSHLTLSDSMHLRKINLNSTDVSGFKHPYISHNLANIIINFHKQHGPFTTIEDLRKVPLVTEELYLKIAHYLKIE